MTVLPLIESKIGQATEMERGENTCSGVCLGPLEAISAYDTARGEKEHQVSEDQNRDNDDVECDPVLDPRAEGIPIARGRKGRRKIER